MNYETDDQCLYCGYISPDNNEVPFCNEDCWDKWIDWAEEEL